jgi:CDP-diacylglycerol--serine O-phosphatidyltransferase
MLTDRKALRKRKIMFKRGASILPSLFTLGNMFCGYVAVISAIKGNIEHSINFLLLALILDSLDGRIARMTGTSSDFGKELDSLADFLSFGVAPALILYFWGFAELDKFGWLLVFLLPLAAGIRLARFNIQTPIVDKRYFVGLPTPAATAAALFPLYFLDKDLLEKVRSDSHTMLLIIKFSALFYVVLIAFAMVSKVRYRSFKDLDFRQRKPAPFFFFVMFFVLLFFLWPEAMLLIIAVTYLLSGQVSYLYEKIRFKLLKKKGEPEVLNE